MENDQWSYRRFLLQALHERKARNPLYSLRSFARDLEISPTTLSDVLKAKRHLSRRNAVKVAERLHFSPIQKEQLLEEISAVIPQREDLTLQMEEDRFRMISEWYYLVILNLSKLESHNATPEWIAKKIGISEIEAQEALERLSRLGLIEIEKGKMIRTSAPIRTSIDIPSSAIRKYHSQNLELANQALENVPVALREISSITFPMDPSQMLKAKEMIVGFKRRLAKLLKTENPSDVYTLNINFFPSYKNKNGASR